MVWYDVVCIIKYHKVSWGIMSMMWYGMVWYGIVRCAVVSMMPCILYILRHHYLHGSVCIVYCSVSLLYFCVLTPIFPARISAAPWHASLPTASPNPPHAPSAPATSLAGYILFLLSFPAIADHFPPFFRADRRAQTFLRARPHHERLPPVVHRRRLFLGVVVDGRVGKAKDRPKEAARDCPRGKC